MYADEFERPQFQSMIDKVWEIKQKCGLLSNIYVDAANSEVIDAIKREFGEDTNWNYIREKIAYCKKNNLYLENTMQIIPVAFSVEGKHMLQHARRL